MYVQSALKRQYHAALSMLKHSIEQCPDDLWNASGAGVPFWRVVYHALFFTEFYLNTSPAVFTPLREPKRELIDLNKPSTCDPFTKSDMLSYWNQCDQLVDKAIDKLDLDAPESGFPWYKIPRLDFQINNIRHIQHHTATLTARLRQTHGISIEWGGFVI